jgi:hypothetical protein
MSAADAIHAALKTHHTPEQQLRASLYRLLLSVEEWQQAERNNETVGGHFSNMMRRAEQARTRMTQAGSAERWMLEGRP